MPEDQWPESSEVMSYLQGIDSKYRYKHLGSFYRSVRCAPFVAAYLSLKAISPTERLISDLRLLRAFDSVWFENVYAIALALGLATLPLEN